MGGENAAKIPPLLPFLKCGVVSETALETLCRHNRLPCACSATMRNLKYKARLRKESGLSCLPLLRREKKGRLDGPVPIFLGHLCHKRHRTLNGLIQIIARRELFCQARIRSVLLG